LKNKVPMRRCVGCMESKPKKEMIRIAAYEGEVTLDLTGKAKGRGVYLCPRGGCLSKALKKNALRRNFNQDIEEEKMEALVKELTAYEEKNQ
jgi:predicted RNA-binding protein YlxR (DUF448 family)